MRRALTAILLGLFPAAAVAQQAPATQPAPVSPVLPGDEGPIPDPNVKDPNLPPDPEAHPPAYRYAKRDYPREVVHRPLTLPEDQAEVMLDVPFVAGDGNPTLTQVLRGAFGVTVDLQLGVTYSVGLERLNAETGEKGFEVGKAVSLDAAYTIFPGYLAAQLRLAFYADPDIFGLALVLGAPFKLTLADRWAIFGAADLVTIKLTGLAVYPADPARNLAAVALDARGGTTPAGSIDLNLGVAFQAKPNLAVWGTVGLGWPDFDTNDQPFALFAGLTYTPRRFWDIGARIGFLSLDDPATSFSIGAFAAVRL